MLNLSYWFPSLSKEQHDVAEYLFHLFVDEQTKQVYYLENYKDRGTNKVFYKCADIKKFFYRVKDDCLKTLHNARVYCFSFFSYSL